MGLSVKRPVLLPSPRLCEILEAAGACRNLLKQVALDSHGIPIWEPSRDRTPLAYI